MKNQLPCLNNFDNFKWLSLFKCIFFFRFCKNYFVLEGDCEGNSEVSVGFVFTIECAIASGTSGVEKRVPVYSPKLATSVVSYAGWLLACAVSKASSVCCGDIYRLAGFEEDGEVPGLFVSRVEGRTVVPDVVVVGCWLYCWDVIIGCWLG